MNAKFEDHIGVCIKNHDGFILERNEVVQKTCGNLCGQVCLEKVRESLHVKENSEIHLTGFNTFHKICTYENHIADIVISEVDGKLVTLIYPLDEEIKETLQKYETYNLTRSEHKIISRLILGHSNQAIADALFISKSTLKKHLNNIYKKIPEKLRPRMNLN